jgi:hypothetical protein
MERAGVAIPGGAAAANQQQQSMQQQQQSDSDDEGVSPTGTYLKSSVHKCYSVCLHIRCC